MRTEEINIYQFDELSEEAKDKAVEWFLSGNDSFNRDENLRSLEIFASNFNIKIKDWSYGGHNSYIKADLNIDSELSAMSGIRLYKFIVNNWDHLFYSLHTRNPIGYYQGGISSSLSRRVKYVKSGKTLKIRVSRIFFEKAVNICGCPRMNSVLLQPIHDFIKKPMKYKYWTMEDILQDCLNAWLFECNKVYEYCHSMEYVIECMHTNEYEFYADGSKY